MMLNRYRERVPVIIEPKGKNAPPIDKRKYMAPRDLNLAQLVYVVRKRLSLRGDQSLFFFYNNNTLVLPSSSIGEVYNTHRDDDGFLYIGYSLENAFG